MALEIERKFLVNSDEWRVESRGQPFCQGYLSRSKGVTVRIRKAGENAYVTIKGPAKGAVRPEFEYEIPLDDAETMLRGLCSKPLIEKVRHEVMYAGRVWVVDEYSAQNAGLVIAEIELSSPDERVELPPWVGDEVTEDMRYRNSELGASPRPRRREP